LSPPVTSEEARVEDLVLDPAAFPNAAELQAEAALGRLNVTTAQGDTDGDGDFDRLYSFGSRSFTIWKADGTLVHDSGDLIERTVLARYPANFNADNTHNDLDDRSDNKGPEPEGIAVARLFGRTLAFIGLERIGGVMVVDVSVPAAPKLLTCFNPRDFTAAPDSAAAGDLGPEGLIVIDAADSPNGRPLLVVANEVSGSTSIIEISSKGPSD
jgi:2',3'-cyclic-nucleotide 2'-phosphodiesterase / 3'-nucleotidase / 5'-nucleotidase